MKFFYSKDAVLPFYSKKDSNLASNGGQVKGFKIEKSEFFSLKTIYVHAHMPHVTFLFDQFCIYMLKLAHKMS